MTEAEELYQRLIAPIEIRMVRMVGRLVRDRDEAEDTMQNVLLKIWKNLEKIDQHPNPHGYILRICATTSFDMLRNRTRRTKHHFPIELGLDAAHGDQGNSSEVSLRYDSITYALSKLPRKQGITILLRLVEDCTYEEIAKILKCSEVTSRSNFSKGMVQLRKLCGVKTRENTNETSG